MGYSDYKESLTFDELSGKNIERLKEYKSCHNWLPSQWLQALVGEIGEYANFRKKYERGDIKWEEFIKAAEKEIADVQIYLDLLANSLGIDLGKATFNKFNEVSDRIGSKVKLTLI